jgi:hypothetical protein
MGRRKGEDTPGAKRRRVPFVAKIKQEDPFRPDDPRAIEAMCRRIHDPLREKCGLAGISADFSGTGFSVPLHFVVAALRCYKFQ